MYYISLGLNMKWLGMLFAVFGMIAALGTGASVQSNSLAESMFSSFGVPGWLTGVVLTIVTALVIVGGIKSIARVTSVIVPFMALFYLLGGLLIGVVESVGGLVLGESLGQVGIFVIFIAVLMLRPQGFFGAKA